MTQEFSKGETNLQKLLQSMNPELHAGEYVFSTVSEATFTQIPIQQVVCFFREQEGITLVVKKEVADQFHLPYSFVAAWITLTVHSALEAVGLTAAFSQALANHQISCNVVAGYYHDHIFVQQNDAQKAMAALGDLARVTS